MGSRPRSAPSEQWQLSEHPRHRLERAPHVLLITWHWAASEVWMMEECDDTAQTAIVERESV
eukprot:SAG25_NODE_456_length_7858_cov_3.295657_4_plen_62_part_00